MLDFTPEYREALQQEIYAFEGTVQSAFNDLGILEKPTPDMLFLAAYKHPGLAEMLDDSIDIASADGKGKAKFRKLLNQGLEFVSKAGDIAEAVRGNTNPPTDPLPSPPISTPVPPVSKKTIIYIVGAVLVVLIGVLIYLKSRKK
jgi:hypothetical protein